MESFLRGLKTLHEKHEKLKHTVHTAWRYPLPKWGQYAMGCVYFTIPVVGGWYVMQWAISKSVEEIGERGELVDVVCNDDILFILWYLILHPCLVIIVAVI